MNEILPRPNHALERFTSSEKAASLECSRCESARHNQYCGAHIIVCLGCKSPNVEFVQFCRICGQPMMFSTPQNEISKTLARKTRDFDILDQAALAIGRLHEIIESIERLELAHQIACSRLSSI
jgi:hypothetical protein